MNATEMRQAVEAIHRDTLTGARHSSELTGLLGAAVTVAKREEEQALCKHSKQPIEREVTNLRGRFATSTCPVCFKLIELKEVM